MSNAKYASLAVALVAGLVAATPADAVTHVTASNATNYCQTALPVFDGNVRKRPLAVQNEGGSNAFVTCAYHSEDGPVLAAQVWFHNSSGVAGDVTCTGVAGYNDPTVRESAVKVVNLPGDGTQVALEWEAVDFPGGAMETGLFAVSCNLQPGMGVDDAYIAYDDGVEPPAADR